MGAAVGHEQLPCCKKPPRVLETLQHEDNDSSGVLLEDNFVLPPAVDAGAVLSFEHQLQQAGIDTSVYGKGNAKPLELLFCEVQDKLCTLETAYSSSGEPAMMKRVVEELQITMVATLNGVKNVLVSTSRILHDGREITRKQLVVYKLGVGQSWEEGIERCFEDRFGLSKKEQERLLFLDKDSYSYREEEEVSSGYPGLTTRYCLHQVVIYVELPMDPAMERLGLSDERDFSTREVHPHRADALRLSMWSWMEADKAAKQGLIPDPEQAKACHSGSRRKSLRRTLSSLKHISIINDEEMAQRVAVPDQLPCKEGYEQKGCPNTFLASMVAGQKLNLAALERAARCIRTTDYTLRNFFDDCCAAFPELRLYVSQPCDALAHGSSCRKPSKEKVTSSGRTTDDEFQRTVGALFAFFWLMRLDIDGKDGFCYGVDDSWKVKTVPTVVIPDTDKPFCKMSKAEKRFHFYTDGPWEAFEELLLDSGLWVKRDNGAIDTPKERVEAMLVLTAVHDIMKIEALIPVVQAGHGPFGGYEEDEEIGDHDLALSYMLEYFPSLLPSVHGLPSASRQLVLFTQSKMDFNNGWLVQAEGPPGRILRTFKKIAVQRSTFLTSSIRHSQQDIGFYFVHWLTDLAGAMPTPLAGSEKFVVAFSHDVLAAFTRSFKVLKQLAIESETAVYENYLYMRWKEFQPPLPEIKPGLEAICRCRLLCMAQHAAPQILAAFERLPAVDRRFLGEEMALTGCRGQAFSGACGGKRDRTSSQGLGGIISFTNGCERVLGCGEAGPAFLVYYGPALLQQNGVVEPDLTLQMLVAILRAGRAIWPYCAEAADETVTLRIDALKACSAEEVRSSMVQGEVWLLVTHTAHEAFVERHPLLMLNSLNKSSRSYQVLSLLQGDQLAARKCRKI